MFRKKRNSHELVPIFVAIALILSFSSIFAPFVIITIIQDFFFKQVPNIWFFQSPVSSYVIAGVAFLYLGIVVGILAYYQSRIKGKKLFKSLGTIIAFVPGIVLIYLTVNQYYYFTNEGIYQNDLFTIEEELYQWEEIEKAIVVSKYNKKNSEVKLSELQLTTKDGETLSYSYNRELIKNQYYIRNVLEDNKVELEQNLEGKEN
ncbi:hypothetical protein [Virgibacillus ndiopensis]|uniref:hypothetical protein n=1 Tax=Virgibacillus ndiopensis TaxID=2004408 RepID=UPI000C07344B|nr:hypothetical protein [Virgibacillus ndiopensis]